MTIKFTGVAPIKPPVPYALRTGCIADFMGGYYGLYGVEAEPGNPDRFFKRVNVVHGDSPSEVLATSRDEQIWQAHETWGAPTLYNQSNFVAAVTVRQGLVAYATSNQGGFGVAVGSLEWDGTDARWGAETLVIDHDSLSEWERERGYVGSSYIKFPGEEYGESVQAVCLGAYQGRVLYVSSATQLNSLVMRWFRFDRSGRLVPDGDWIYKLGIRANYGNGLNGGLYGVQGKYLYLSSSYYNYDGWWVGRIDMETMAFSEVKVADISNEWEAVAIGSTLSGVEMPTNGYTEWRDRDHDAAWSTRISPQMEVSRRSVTGGHQLLQKEFPEIGFLTGGSQFIPQTALLNQRHRDMYRFAYLPDYDPSGGSVYAGWVLHTLDGKEYVAWRGPEVDFGSVGSGQLYIGTTHAILTLNEDKPDVWFFSIEPHSDLAAGEHSSRGFFS